ncbi:MAG: hypothetical protein ACM3UZ_15945 [Acidobacteriota bacterium]
MEQAKKRLGAELIEYTCKACGKHITWALPGAMVLCPTCNKWNTIKKEILKPVERPAVVPELEKNEENPVTQPELWD